MNAVLACVIIFSAGTNGNWQEKRNHELAHCNGWQHPIRASVTGKAFDPPRRYVRPYAGKLIEHRVSVSEAKRICEGPMACQWFE